MISSRFGGYLNAFLVAGFCASQSTGDLLAHEVQSLCLELGVTPATMTAMGLDLQSARESLERIEQQDTLVASLRETQSQIGVLAIQLKAKRHEARTAETASDAQAAEASAATLETQMASLSASMESAKNQLRVIFMPAGTDEGLIERVCDPTMASFRLPVEYRVLGLSDADARALSDALAAQTQAHATSEPVPADAQQIINQYVNQPQVTAARNAMSAWMAQVEQLFFLWQ